MILANFNLISAIYTPSSDTLIVSGNVYSVPHEGDLVTLNGSLYIVYSVSWAYANPDTNQNMAQTATVRVLSATASSSSGSGSSSNSGCGC
jgi:hypothetical protein